MRYPFPRFRQAAACGTVGPLAGLAPVAALAGTPYCQIEQACRGTSDNCTPEGGRVTIDVLPSGKAAVTLRDRAPLESTILDMNGLIMLICHDDRTEHQLRINPEGSFTYLISVPDPDAPKGKDQVMYRGQCVEG